MRNVLTQNFENIFFIIKVNVFIPKNVKILVFGKETKSSFFGAGFQEKKILNGMT